MRKGFIINCAFITCFLFNSTVTWPLTLDFEGGCGSIPAPAGCKETISTTGFSSDVQFIPSASGVNIVAQLGAPAFPFSPSRSARWDPDQTLPDDPFRANFLIPEVNSVSVVLGDNGQDADDLFLKAFNQDGNIVAQDFKTLLANVPGGLILSVTAPNIAHVEFGRFIGQVGEGNSILFDNFTFEHSKGPSAIPEPSTALMMCTGLLCLILWWIRRENTVC